MLRIMKKNYNKGFERINMKKILLAELCGMERKMEVDMKKPLLVSMILVIIDQAVKLFISYYFINDSTILLSGILRFHPVQNTNLMWIASILNYNTPVFVMLIIQILGLALIILAYRYLSSLWSGRKYLLNGMAAFFAAGIICSFADVVFWSGSLDFIRLFDWFTFDLKDVYLNIGAIHVFLYEGIYFFKVYRKLNEEERRRTGLFLWIKRGMPSESDFKF